ncbi:MAG: glycosyl transferase family 2 [Cytophagaceae bacterium]|jgi:glycosyltransferase involved in cell wall biosynthesis|nr:glycosyl transferase family 2 [Cytophagaceae bacterium]
MNSPFFSIIIPVYNSSKYLHKCLDSIVNQSYKDFELILVNDGSKDNSLDICTQYADRYGFISVINQPNQGVSAARNNGLKKAIGNYVTFIDSDDFIEQEYLLHFYNESANADLIVGGIVTKYEDDLTAQRNTVYVVKDKTLSNQEKIIQLENKYLLSGAVAKCYKNEIIKKHALEVDVNFHFGEDALFNLVFCMHAQSIALCDFVGYNYIQRETDSLVKRKYSFEQTNLFANTISAVRLEVKKKFGISAEYDMVIDRERTLFKINAISSMYKAKFFLPRKQRVRHIREELKNLNLSSLPDTSNYYTIMKGVFLIKTPFLIDFLLKLLYSRDE